MRRPRQSFTCAPAEFAGDQQAALREEQRRNEAGELRTIRDEGSWAVRHIVRRLNDLVSVWANTSFSFAADGADDADDADDSSPSFSESQEKRRSCGSDAYRIPTNRGL